MAGVGAGQALALVAEVLRETRFGHVWLATVPFALVLPVL